MTTHVIVLDLNNTLLTSKRTLLPPSLEAFSHARKVGYQLITIIGRHHVATHPFYQALALDTPAICCNDIYLYDYQAKKVLESDPLPVDQALQLIEVLGEYQIHEPMYVGEAMLCEHPTGRVVRIVNWARTPPSEQCPAFTQVPLPAQAAHDANVIWKLVLTDGDIPKLQQFDQYVEQQLGLKCEWSWHNQVDITRKGDNKGRRLIQWIEIQGGSMENVIAFGDNFNDISMLETAGTGVAMDNVDDAVKVRANIMTGDNTTDSVAKSIYSHLL